MIVTGDDGWLFYRGLENSLRVLTELLLTIPKEILLPIQMLGAVLVIGGSIFAEGIVIRKK